MIAKTGKPVLLEVDGGIKVDNAGEIVNAGADILVAGSAIFETPGRDYRTVIARLRAAGSTTGDGNADEPKTSNRSAKARR